jgi:RND family efflux transporter MFP subunit
MKRLVLIVFLVMIVGWVGCRKGNDQQYNLEKKPIHVKVAKVKRDIFTRALPYKGTVHPWQRANIGPDISGRIWKIYKKQGDRVKKDELLAELDTTNMNLQKKQAEAALAVALASYKDAELNFNRIASLYEKKAVSRMQYEKTQLALEVAETQNKSAEANLNVIKHTLGNSYMRAPFDGIITSKNHEEGDTINPMMGMSSGVLTLMDLTQVKIILDIPAEDIEKVQVGQPCLVRVSSLSDEEFSGEVYTKNLAADLISKTFQVEVKVKNPGIKIKAGIFAEVSIEFARKEDTLILPLSALTGENQVVVYDNGKAKWVTVEVGDRNESEFEVVSGLSEGTPVVMEGNYDLREGSLIAVEENANEDR